MAKLFANSRDPDQTPRSVASDLGLHCLPVTLLGVSRLQWVKCIPLIGSVLDRFTLLTYFFLFFLLEIPACVCVCSSHGVIPFRIYLHYL